MPAVLLCAQFTDKELTLRKQTRAGARRTLPNPAATARALALATCEVEAGLRSASQLERICHPSLWDAVANRIQRAGGPPVSVASVLRSRSRSSRRAWSMPWTRAWPWCPSLPCTAPRSPGARSSDGVPVVAARRLPSMLGALPAVLGPERVAGLADQARIRFQAAG